MRAHCLFSGSADASTYQASRRYGVEFALTVVALLRRPHRDIGQRAAEPRVVPHIEAGAGVEAAATPAKVKGRVVRRRFAFGAACCSSALQGERSAGGCAQCSRGGQQLVDPVRPIHSPQQVLHLGEAFGEGALEVVVVN